MAENAAEPADDGGKPKMREDRTSSDEQADSRPPPPGCAVSIGANLLRVLGHADNRLVIVSVTPPFALFLMPDAAGVPALISFEGWAKLAAEGTAKVLPPPRYATLADAADRIVFQCERLNAAGVPNGAKAIAIWLHQNWTSDLISRFGEHDNPHTLRRWRSKMRHERAG